MTVDRLAVAVMLSASSAALTAGCTSSGDPQHGLPPPPPVPEGVDYASDGQRFSGADSEAKALVASGAHDLSCPITAVTIQHMVDEHGKAKLVVDGCGRRAFYFWNTINAAPSTYEHHAVLENVVPLAPPAPT